MEREQEGEDEMDYKSDDILQYEQLTAIELGENVNWGNLNGNKSSAATENPHEAALHGAR
jgi:hypothetical protein